MTGEVRFKSTMDVELVDWMGDDSTIASSARVSTKGRVDEGSDAVDQNLAGLINFLMRDRHGTPFEHNALTFRVSAPLFVFYEWHRHRVGWSYNEESARYRELEPVFYVPSPERALRQVGKPGAYEFTPGDHKQQVTALGTHKRAAMTAWGEYRWMLDHGIAREVARNVLPVSIFKTQYATTNMRALMHFLSLRWAHPLNTVPSFPLREIEMVAEKLDILAREHFPITMAKFDTHGRIAP